MNNNYVKKFIAYSYGTFISLLIGLFVVGITTRLFSPEIFGKSSLFITVVGLLVIVILVGSDQAYVRYFYETKEEFRSVLLKRCLKLPLILLLILSIPIFLFFKEISIFIFDEISFPAITILYLTLISETFHRYALLLIRLKQRAHLFSLIAILSRVLELLVILILYNFIGENYIVLIMSFFLTSFTFTIISILLSKSDWKIKKISDSSLVVSNKEIFNFSFPLMFTLVLHWAFASIDKISLNIFSSYEDLGIYSSASKLIFLITAAQSVFTTFWIPISQEHFSKYPKDTEFFKKTFSLVSYIIFMLMIFVIALKDVFVLILGNDYQLAATIMPFLAFGPVLYTLSETTVMGISFTKKTKWNILITLIVSIINISGNLLLVPIYGAFGAAVSTAVSYVVFYFLRTYISNHLYVVKYGYIKQIFLILIAFSYSLASIITNDILFFLITLLAFGVVSIIHYKELKIILSYFIIILKKYHW